MKSFIGYSYREDVIGKPPTGNYLYKTLGKNWINQSSNSSQEHLKQIILEGKAVAPGLYEDGIKTKPNFIAGQLILLDFDGTMNWELAKNNEFFKEHFFCAFTTASHRDVVGGNRFRVIGILPEPCETAGEYDAQIDALRLHMRDLGFPDDDTSMQSAQCSFGNPEAEHIWWDAENRLPHLEIDLTPPPRKPSSALVVQGEDIENRVSKAKLCLSYIPPRGEPGSNTYPEAWHAVCCLVNEFGTERAYQIADECDWLGEWDLLDEMEKVADQPEDQQVTLGGLVHSTREYLQHATPDCLEEFNAKLSLLSVIVPEVIDPVQVFGTCEGFRVDGIVHSAVDQEPTKDEIQTALVAAQGQSDIPALQLKQMIQHLYTSQGKIRFNELTQEIEVCGEPMKTYHFEDAKFHLYEKLGVLTSNGDAQAVIRNEANKNRYNPVAEYLQVVANDPTLEIDLDLVASRCLGVNDALSKAMVKAWLIGAVSKVMNPEGSNFIEVLTLVSTQQGIGKSEFFKSLASPKWFSDSFAQTENEKDRLLVLHSSWVNEISEVDQFVAHKRDFKQMKGIISATSDQMRIPYGRCVENKPRHFVLGATSNEEELYAGDDQQRRFWSINVKPSTKCGRLDIQWLQDNRSAIWATAARLYQQFGDDAFKLTTEQKAQLIDHNQQEFTRISSYHDVLSHELKEKNIQKISVNQTYEICDIDKINQTVKNEIAGIMKAEGYVKRRNVKGDDGRVYSSVWINEERSVNRLGKSSLGF